MIDTSSYSCKKCHQIYKVICHEEIHHKQVTLRDYQWCKSDGYGSEFVTSCKDCDTNLSVYDYPTWDSVDRKCRSCGSVVWGVST
jgi:ribosomal protein S27E